MVFEPDEHTCLHQYAWTRDRLLLVTLADVASRVEIVTPGTWQREPVAGHPGRHQHRDRRRRRHRRRKLPGLQRIRHAVAAAARHRRRTPRADQVRTGLLRRRRHHRDTAFRAVGGRHVDSLLRRCAPDGTAAPGPTLLGGYGGFELSSTPGYAGVLGRLWLARGGTYVLANIRGGGEYGPGWHTQAMREGRHKVAEDFAAVATDLVDRGITTVEQLGAQGGSNGGLLMGIMLTKYPELFGALVCQVPLLDMRRFHLLLAGASWVAEYGDPGQPRGLGVHLRILAVPEYFGHPDNTRRCCSPPRPATTGCIRAMPARWRRRWRPRATGLVLREHRGRPRRRGRQRAGRVQVGAELLVPVADADWERSVFWRLWTLGVRVCRAFPRPS